METRKKWISRFLIGLVFLAFVSGGTMVAAAPKVELTLMNFWVQGDARYEVLQESLKAFQAKNPDITVSEQTMSVTPYETKAKAVAASGDMPDVFLMRGNWAKEFSSLGVINPCDDFVNADAAYKGALSQAALANHIYNGKIYSIPYSLDMNSLVYYNKALFDKYKLAFPKTWDQLLNVIKVFKSNNIIPIAFGNKGTWLAECSFLGLFLNRAAGTEGTKYILSGKGKFTDAPYLETVKRTVELVDAGAFNSDFATIDDYEQQGIYGQGKAAMFVEGNWACATFKKVATDEIYNNTWISVLPALPGGKGDLKTVDGGSGWGWNISSKLTGAKKEAAIKLVKALSDMDFAKRLIELANMIPAVKDAKFDKSKVPVVFSRLMAATQGFSLSPVPDQVLDPQIESELEKTFAAALVKSMTPEEAAASVQAVMERVLSGN